MSAYLTQTTLLRAARCVDDRTDTANPWILLAGDVIRSVGSGRDAPDANETIDLGDVTLVPGFIDIHGHGGAGGAYDEGPEEIQKSLRLHRQHGTTRSVLSLLTNPVPALARSLASIRTVMENDPLVLGAHLEGPFLSALNHGAHEPGHLVAPTPDNVDAVIEAGRGVLRQVTLAPEVPGAMDAIAAFTSNGVIAAVGHTIATYETARNAFDAGATLLTHAFNAMPGIHHRRPGPIMAAIDDDRVTLELILDGVHVAPVVARTLFHAAPGRVALITDAMAAAGAPDGTYRLGSLAVDVVAGVARIAGGDTIAGSTLTQDLALRIGVHHAGLGMQEAVAALTASPAAALGLGHRLGRLAPGFAADVVAITPTLEIADVWADGVRQTRPL